MASRYFLLKKSLQIKALSVLSHFWRYRFSFQVCDAILLAKDTNKYW